MDNLINTLHLNHDDQLFPFCNTAADTIEAQGGKHIPLEDFYKPLVFEKDDWLIVHLHGVEKGREAERAQIVEFAADWMGDIEFAQFKHAIEAGEHLK